jgi:hypothetical protein
MGMIAHRDDHLDMLAAQVAGCLDEADRFELEAHLASGCAVCAAERVRLEEGAALMAASAPARGPSPALRARIMERVRADVQVGWRRAAGAPCGRRPTHARSGLRTRHGHGPRRPQRSRSWRTSAGTRASGCSRRWRRRGPSSIR